MADGIDDAVRVRRQGHIVEAEITDQAADFGIVDVIGIDRRDLADLPAREQFRKHARILGETARRQVDDASRGTLTVLAGFRRLGRVEAFDVPATRMQALGEIVRYRPPREVERSCFPVHFMSRLFLMCT